MRVMKNHDRSQDFYFLIKNNVIDVILYKNQG